MLTVVLLQWVRVCRRCRKHCDRPHQQLNQHRTHHWRHLTSHLCTLTTVSGAKMLAGSVGDGFHALTSYGTVQYRRFSPTVDRPYFCLENQRRWAADNLVVKLFRDDGRVISQLLNHSFTRPLRAVAGNRNCPHHQTMTTTGRPIGPVHCGDGCCCCCWKLWLL